MTNALTILQFNMNRKIYRNHVFKHLLTLYLSLYPVPVNATHKLVIGTVSLWPSQYFSPVSDCFNKSAP